MNFGRQKIGHRRGSVIRILFALACAPMGAAAFASGVTRDDAFVAGGPVAARTAATILPAGTGRLGLPWTFVDHPRGVADTDDSDSSDGRRIARCDAAIHQDDPPSRFSVPIHRVHEMALSPSNGVCMRLRI